MTRLDLRNQTAAVFVALSMLTACSGQPALSASSSSTAPTSPSSTVKATTATTTQPTVGAPTGTPQQPSPAPTMTASSSESPRFPTLDATKFPRDKAGRVLGGNQPIINYSPDMVTGKPCPRVTTWQPRPLKQVSGPAGDFFVASDPCVVQNAIDDFAQIAWAIPWYNDREQMLDVEKLYQTDPALKKGIDPGYFKRALEGKKYQDVWIAYRVCSPPLLSLIVPSEQSKLDRNGKVIEIGLVDVTPNLATTACNTIRFDSGAVLYKRQRFDNEERQKGSPVFAFWMFWSESDRSWKFGGLANPYGKLTLQQVQSLYDKAKYKP